MSTIFDFADIDQDFDTDFTTPYIFEFKMKSTKNAYDTDEETFSITVNIDPCDGGFTEFSYQMPTYTFNQGAQEFCFFAINSERCA